MNQELHLFQALGWDAFLRFGTEAETSHAPVSINFFMFSASALDTADLITTGAFSTCKGRHIA